MFWCKNDSKVQEILDTLEDIGILCREIEGRDEKKLAAIQTLEQRIKNLENEVASFPLKLKHLEEACFHMISKEQNVVISLKERVEKLEEAQKNFKHKNKHHKDRLATRHNCKEAQCPQPCST